MHISTLFPHNGVLQRGRHNGRRTTGKMMQTAKCPFAKNRHAQKYVLRKSGFPKDVFAKILDIQDRGLRKIRVRSFSKDFFTHVLRKTAMPKNMFCENLVSPRMCLRWISRMRKIRVRSFSKDMPKNMFCENLVSPRMCLRNPGYPGPWFAKDQGQILKRFAIVKLFVATCAHILINEENNIFLRKVGFLKHAGHKSLRLIAKWQLDNIYVEPLVCEEPGPGSSQTGCWYLGCFKQTRGLRKAVLGNKQLFEKNQALVLRKQGVQHRCYPAAILRSIWATCGQHFWENKFFAKKKVISCHHI